MVQVHTFTWLFKCLGRMHLAKVEIAMRPVRTAVRFLPATFFNHLLTL